MRKKKLNRGVAVVGAGMSKFGAFPEFSTRDLFVQAFQDMHLAKPNHEVHQSNPDQNLLEKSNPTANLPE